MRKIMLIKSTLGFAVFGLAVTAGPLPIVAQQSPSFAKQVRPFLAKYCSECHNAKELKGGLNLESFRELQKGADSGPIYVAGEPDMSPLVVLAEGKDSPRMPPRKARQPKANEVAVLRAWVAAGAKDDSTEAKVAIPDIKPQQPVATPISGLAYRADGDMLAVGKYDRVALVDPKTNAALGQLTAIPTAVTALAFSGDGKHLAVAAGRPGQAPEILLYDVPATGDLWPKPKTAPQAHKDAILDLAFGPDSKVLATTSYDTTVRIWDTATLKQKLVLKEHSDAVYGAAFSPDGKLLATAGADRAVKVWLVESGKLLYTHGEATDWVYAVAWSGDGRQLAAAGVDKSIRVWRTGVEKGKLLHSVFAHEAPIIRLVYAPDSKTLFSLGEDRIAKAWDADRMVERKIYARQPEATLALALRPDQKQLALGRYDGILVFIDPNSGETQKTDADECSADDKHEELKPITEKESNDSPTNGQLISLSATIEGSCAKAGDVDFFRFQAGKGQEIGVRVITAEIKSKLEPYLELTDTTGKVLVASERGFLGFTCAEAGTYAIGIRDRDYRGGKDMIYRLTVGEVPVVTSIFPAGVQRGTETDVAVFGVNLGNTKSVRVKADAAAALDSKLPLKIETPFGPALGAPSVIVGECPEVQKDAIPVPGTANGVIQSPGESDFWSFRAKKGERLIVEVNSRRLGFDLDSVIEILDGDNRPVERAVLRSLAKTYVTFRDHNSVQPNIRIEAWEELDVNDYIYVGNQLLRIDALPTHPDADCNFFVDRGQRIGWLDTTPIQVAKGEPMYKVTIHPPGTVFPPNGFPVIALFYRNDDGGPGYGRDSRLFFDPPADGEYRVRIGDANSRGGVNYVYRLTIRPPRPRFTVSLTPANPSVPRGGALPINVTAVRFDGFDGEIQLKAATLPKGFSAPETAIPAGENSTAFALFVDAGAKEVKSAKPFAINARAMIDGKELTQSSSGGVPKLVEPGDIVTTTEATEVRIKPGTQASLTVNIDRRNNFKGRVPLTVRGLPHGVRVLDIGLNGILITEREARRTIVLYAEPWVQAMEHPFVVSSRREGNNEEHAARSVLLRIVND